MLAVEEAVVGGVDQQRVVELAAALERVEDRADGVVDRQQRLQLLLVVLLDRRDPLRRQARQVGDDLGLGRHVGLVEARRARQRAAREGVAVARRRRRGPERGGIVGIDRRAAVRGGEGEREEEGLRRRSGLVDQLRRAAAIEVGLVLARVLEAGPVEDLAVLVGLPALVVEDALADARDPVVPARRDLGDVGVLDAVAVEVAADVHRPVAGRLEPERERVRVVEVDVAAEVAGVVDHAVVVRVLAGQVGGARRAAERVAGDRLGEGRALGLDQADVALDRGRGDRLVVGHDEDDVRLRLRGGWGEQRGQRHGEQRKAARGTHGPRRGRSGPRRRSRRPRSGAGCRTARTARLPSRGAGRRCRRSAANALRLP